MSRAHLSREQLVALALDEALLEGRDHLIECEACRLQLAQFLEPLQALRQAPIPVADESVRRQQVLRALTVQRPEKAAGGWERWWRWWRWPRPLAWGGGMAAAAAMVVLFFVLRGGLTSFTSPIEPLADYVIRSGVVTTDDDRMLEPGNRIDMDRVLEASSEATLVLGKGSILEASQGSEFMLLGEGKVVTLHSGSLSFDIKKMGEEESFVVETREARARVLGTRFRVDRIEERTSVVVEEGRVEVTDRLRGEVPVVLGAGERVDVRGQESLVEDAGVEAGWDAAVEVSEEVALPGVADIRRTLRAGKVSEALEMIRHVRSKRGGGAELAMVEAEALLASGQGGRAVQAYLNVTRQYPGTRQAEEALFAAAQLSVDYSGRSQRGQQLLREYLQKYPSGRFHVEAKRLLAALEAKAP